MKDFFEDPLIQLALHKRGGGGGGSSIDLESLNVSANGQYNAPSGSAYDEVNVNVPQPEEAFLEASYNGTFYPDEGSLFNGVRVACPEPKEEDTLNANANGQYTPESGHVYSEVNVNVPSKTEDTLNANANGQYTPQSGHVYSEVNVNVPGKTEDTLNVSANGQYTPESGHVYDEVNVNCPTPKTEDALSVTQNGQYTPASGHVYSSVAVNVQSAAVEPKDVIFIDYDGTIVHSYTAAEFAALTALPANPSHTGLTAQGWNWTLADAKAYVAKYGILVIGQLYTTTDGKTRVHIHVDDLSAARMYVEIRPEGGAARYVDIDWGDGNVDRDQTVSAGGVLRVYHDYAATGDYVITLNAVSHDGVTAAGKVALYGTSGHSAFVDGGGSYYTSEILVRKVNMGDNVILANGALQRLPRCEVVSMSATSFDATNIDGALADRKGNVFRYSDVKAVVVPSGLTNLWGYSFADCPNLEYVSLPKSVVSIDSNEFNNCGVLRICLPEGLTTLNQYALQKCPRLSELVIPATLTATPSSMTQDTQRIEHYHFTSGNDSDLETLNALAYQNFGCEKIVLPEGLVTVGAGCFYYAESLRVLDIPSTVTTIGNNFCNQAKSIMEVHVRATNPPSLGSSAFQSVYTDYVIYVPAASLETYKAATNWASIKTHIQAEP